MSMNSPMRSLLVTFELDARGRSILEAAMDGCARIVELPGLDGAGRKRAIDTAQVVLARHPHRELSREELAAMGHVQLVQLMTAGVDFIPMDWLPAGVPIASNAGAYAGPMAEHAIAMALAALKRLFVEHRSLVRGEFNQYQPNRMLGDTVCGILGYGGIGRGIAGLLRGFGARVHAINRSGRSDDALDWIGSVAQLDQFLPAVDVLFVCAPLTRATEGMLGEQQLGRMKEDAVLVNLARGQIVDEAALYAHLRLHPGFTACIEAWWVEPVRHGVFRMDHPFMELPNVIGSPHNSASVAHAVPAAIRSAGLNCRRQFLGEQAVNLVRPHDRYL